MEHPEHVYPAVLLLKTFAADPQTIDAGETMSVRASARVDGLNFWSWGYGYLYDVVTTLNVNGKPVDPDATYTVATNSFVADQWARYVGGAPMEVRSTGRTVRDVVEERVRAEGIVSVPPVGATPH